MKTLPLLLPMVLSAQLCAQGADPQPIQKSFQRGLMEEEVNRDFQAAAEAYRSTVEEFDLHRATAAAALFRLAECTRELGQTNEAWAFYERIVREFADQTNFASLSRAELERRPQFQQRIRAIVRRNPFDTSGASEALARQKQLLEEELSLVEEQLAIQQKQVENGRMSSTELIPTQRDILSIKRQIAELDVRSIRPDLSVLGSAPDAGLRPEVGGQLSPRFVSHQIQKGETLSGIVKLLNATYESQGLTTTIEALQTANPDLEPTALAVGETIRVPLIRARDSSAVASTGDANLNDEDKEIARYQEMLKDSPDLINAGLGVMRRTPLHSAAERGQMKLAEFLLDNGADIRAVDELGNTALHAASASGHKSMVELLLQRGAVVDAPTKKGGTALNHAAALGLNSVAEALLDAGANVDARCDADLVYTEWDPSGNRMEQKRSILVGTPLHQAAGAGYLSMVELLLRRGADIDAMADGVSTSPLQTALQSRQRRVAAFLLEQGADVDTLDESGSPVLHRTIRSAPDLVDQVLARKPNLEVRDADGLMPLQYAFVWSNAATVEKLLRAGANPNVPYLQQGGRSDLAAAWLRRRANPSGAPGIRPILATSDIATYGPTLLHLAAMAGDTNLCGLLLEYGAEVDAHDSSNRTPLHVALRPLIQESTSQHATARQLLDAGANVNAADNKGNRPLLLAVQNLDKEMVALLLEHGADRSATDYQGRTAMMWLDASQASNTVADPIRVLLRQDSKKD